MDEWDQERRIRIATVSYAYEDQPKVEVSQCNLCGEKRWVVLTHRDRYGFPAKANACTRCGLVFLSPVMGAEAYRLFYAEYYRSLVSAYHGRRIDAEAIQGEQQVYAVELAEFLSPFVPKDRCSTLLDIGGSTGLVANHLSQQFGVKATILDPSPSELEQAQRLGLKTIPGLFEDFDPASGEFDLVIMCQTVSHLLDVSSAMQKIHRLLTPSGLFYVDIVDFRADYLRNWSVEGVIKIDHPFYLTEASVETYLIRAGFEVLRINYWSDYKHIGYLCRLAEPRPDYLPAVHTVEELLREVRMIQNAPRMMAR